MAQVDTVYMVLDLPVILPVNRQGWAQVRRGLRRAAGLLATLVVLHTVAAVPATGLDAVHATERVSGLAAVVSRRPTEEDVGDVVHLEGSGTGPVDGATVRRLGGILADLVMADLDRDPPRGWEGR